MKKIDFALVKSELGSWINENGQELLEKEILKAETLAVIGVVPDVKYKKTLKFLSTDALVQAASCGTRTSSGTTTLTDKEVYTKSYVVYEELCPEDLNDTSLDLSMTPGYNESLPFEANYTNNKSKQVALKIENKHWVNASGATEFEGTLNQIAADSDVQKYTFDFTATGITDAQLIAAYRGLIELVPEEIVGLPDLTLFLGHEAFRKLSTAFLNTNNILLQKFDFNGVTVFDFPGSEYIKIYPVNGLNAGNNTNRIAVITPKSNLLYITDLKGEESKTQMWWSQDKGVLCWETRWKQGASYKFGEYIVATKKS